ncbi:MAG: hypothetical protein Q7R33_05920 [Nitrosarchaeum sp.]|nr:hypothetical protein [Nitrosarchaeum sp.]
MKKLEITIRIESSLDDSAELKVNNTWFNLNDGLDEIVELIIEHNNIIKNFHEELKQIILEDVPHQYQNRLLEKLQK